MGTLTAVAVVAALGLGLLAWKWKHGSVSIVLAALPLALLFPVLPVPPAIWSMIRGFQQMSQAGAGGVQWAAALCLHVSRPLFWGTMGFVVVMTAAAAMQAMAQRDQAPDSETTAVPAGAAESGFLIGSSLLALPAVYLTHLTAGIPRIIMAAASRSSGPAAETPGSEALSQTSQLISSRLVTAVLVGLPLGVLLLLFAVASLVMLRSRRVSAALLVYSWIVWAVCVLLAIWNIVQLNSDIHALGRALE
jgi:hypothetical protein